MAKRCLAYICLIVGVAGVVLPVIPGIPFLIVGVRLLGRDHWLARRAASLAGGLRNSQ
jgi:uncharacterized membrane protein YbaN (DUF454 family)